MNLEAMTYDNEHVLKLMEGCYDLHVHPNPDTKVRGFDDFSLIEELDRFHMGGAVIKFQQGTTAGRATIANQYGCGGHAKARLYDSIVLNNAVGGLNLRAVDVAWQMGAKMVWMPTRDSVFDQLNMSRLPVEQCKNGLKVTDDYGRLKPEVLDIMAFIKEKDMIMATGHLSVDETVTLCKAAADMNVKTIMTHPEWIPLDIQCEMGKLGIAIEKIWHVVNEAFPDGATIPPARMPMAQMAEVIRKIGVEHIIISTDASHPPLGSCPHGMYCMTEGLVNHGFSDEDIRWMIRGYACELLDVN